MQSSISQVTVFEKSLNSGTILRHDLRRVKRSQTLCTSDRSEVRKPAGYPERHHSHHSSTIVFIDSAVDDYQTLVNGVIPGAEIILLNPAHDGIEQITEVLKGRTNPSTVHIISHGSPGCLYLGNTQLSLDTLDRYTPQLQTWFTTPPASLLLYGCNIAADETGAIFVQQLSELTGATIAASTTRTGSAALGGNWEFEVRTGDIEANLAFEPWAITAYNSVLPTTLYDSSLGGTPDTQQGLIYVAFAVSDPLGVTQTFNPGSNTTTLNSTGNQVAYAGYGTSSFTLDRNIGYSINFTVEIVSEGSPFPNISNPDKNGDGNRDRAGFSIIAISSDRQGIELGFWGDKIWAQQADPLGEPPAGNLFTYSPLESAQFNTTGSLQSYTLTVLGNNYTLSSGATTILSGILKDYTNGNIPPTLPNPYTIPNSIFLGDNTPSAQAQINLSSLGVNRVPNAPTSDTYSTNEDIALTVAAATGVLANDTDADNDLLTAVLASNPTNGTLVLNPDGTFTYTPNPNFSGSDSFTYRTSDGTANSNTLATVAIAVDAVADAPTLTVAPASGNPNTAIPLNLNATFVDTDGSETLSLQLAGVPTDALLSAGTNLGNGVWQLSLAQLAGLTITPATSDDFALTVTATATETSNNNAASTVATLNVTVTDSSNPNPTDPSLVQNSNGTFTVQGLTQLLFTSSQVNTSSVNEIGFFIVDDAQGNIGNLTPSDAGYAQAALDQAQVIFSVLADNPSNAPSTRQLSFTNGTFLRFYQIENSTTDAVRAGQSPLTAISFNSPTFSAENTLDFGENTLTVEATNQPFPLGTGFQGSEQGELLDLTQQVGQQLQANFTVNSEAAYDNFVGFYAIDSLDGGIDINQDGQIDLRPGDMDYAEAAIQRTVLQASLQSTRSLTSSVLLDAGTLLAPYIIADGTREEFLAQNPDNQSSQFPLAYFVFLGANPDGADHVRLLGDNTFGFEDLFGGGDADFNDVVIQINFA
ncbi:MAG: DUF4347 domain-containing protein [Coleofasciculus sp. S288]|nr:DUF4347 domain-containing protein [Coleofasciculus sp. S288]